MSIEPRDEDFRKQRATPGSLFRPSAQSAPLCPTPPELGPLTPFQEAVVAEQVENETRARALSGATRDDPAGPTGGDVQKAYDECREALDEEEILKARTATAPDGWVVREEDDGLVHGCKPGHPLGEVGLRTLSEALA